jgi:hypothetical protein
MINKNYLIYQKVKFKINRNQQPPHSILIRMSQKLIMNLIFCYYFS